MGSFTKFTMMPNSVATANALSITQMGMGAMAMPAADLPPILSF